MGGETVITVEPIETAFCEEVGGYYLRVCTGDVCVKRCVKCAYEEAFVVGVCYGHGFIIFLLKIDDVC